MTTVRFFAAAEEAVGSASLERTEPTLGELRDALTREFPILQPMLPKCAVLVDGARVDDATLIASADVIDVLPPFAGG